MGDDVSPMTQIDRRQMQRPEPEHKPRVIPQFQPPRQQPPEVTLGQRIDNAITAVRDFFSFSDALKGGREQQKP